MKKKAWLEGKRFGFYVTLALIVLSIAMAAVYAGCYQATSYMSWKVFGCALGGALLALAFSFTKLAGWSNAVGLLFYIYSIYFYVSSVLVGIQGSVFSIQFLICTGGLAGLFVLNLINVFLKQED